MWIASAEHIRRMEDRALQEFGMPAEVLMERAGAAVMRAVIKLLPTGGRIAVVAGKGNNGGDALVSARLLFEKGYEVHVFVASEESELRPSMRDQLLQVKATGVRPIFYTDARWRRRMDCLGTFDLIIDGMLGIGASGTVSGPVEEAIECVNRSGVPVIAVDVPSGIDPDSGQEMGDSIWALKTITFGLPKPFLFQSIGLEHAGYWEVADIGFPEMLRREPTDARMLDAEWVLSLMPERLKDSHKNANGHVLIVAGSLGMRGAAVLSAMASVRTGAGLVTVAGIPAVCDAVASSVPEALLLPLPEKDGAIAVEAAETLLNHQSRYGGAVFGPGLTHSPAIQDLLGEVWAHWTVPSIIDADALNAISAGVLPPGVPTIYTPHPGEMSRLMKVSTGEVQSDRFSIVDQAVKELNTSILIKGPHSIVGSPYEPKLVNPTGNAGLASAGMGDVLSGMIGTLLAQDLPPYYAAGCAMYWHGYAADMLAEEIAPIGYTASEVASAIPRARAKLSKSCAKSSGSSPDRD